MSGVQAGQCLAADAQDAEPVIMRVWIISRFWVLSKRPASVDGRLSFIGGIGTLRACCGQARG